MCDKDSRCRFPMCLIEGIENMLMSIFYFFMWIAYSIFNPGLSLNEFLKKGFKEKKNSDNIDNLDDEITDLLLSEKKIEYDRELKRLRNVEEKTRALLPVSSALLIIMGFIFESTQTTKNTNIGNAILLSAVVVTIGILLVLMQYGTYKYTSPILSNENIEINKSKLKKTLLKKYISAILSMDGLTNYQVNLQRAARRAIIIGTIFLITTILYYYIF